MENMERDDFLERIKTGFVVHPIIALLGPRQSGKTTLARKYISQMNLSRENYFDLENPEDLNRLSDPMLTLQRLTGLIVIDEIQRAPDLYPILRVLVDDPNIKQQYLILGSASRELLQQSSESLAGRIEYIEVTPFSYKEVSNLEQLWLRGGFPLSFLAANESQSLRWRGAYIKTYLEQDIPNLGIEISSKSLYKFWMMITHYHGNILNASEIGRSLNINYKTVKKYIDILSSTFMLRQLQPWFENIGKRQVKSPKIYLRDSGILHALMKIERQEDLDMHVKVGASWEGFALEEVIRQNNISDDECFFWSTLQKAELDLLILKNGKKYGFEFKYCSAPKITKSMKIAIDNINLEHLYVIYPGNIEYPLADNITAKPLAVKLTL